MPTSRDAVRRTLPLTSPTAAAAVDGRLAAPTTAAIQLSATGLWKKYHKSRVEIPVLRGVDLQVQMARTAKIQGAVINPDGTPKGQA